MKYQFIDKYRSAFAVEKMCRALKVSKSGYYAWKARPRSTRARENENLDHHIRTIYRKTEAITVAPESPRHSTIKTLPAAKIVLPGECVSTALKPRPKNVLRSQQIQNTTIR